MLISLYTQDLLSEETLEQQYAKLVEVEVEEIEEEEIVEKAPELPTTRDEDDIDSFFG